VRLRWLLISLFSFTFLPTAAYASGEEECINCSPSIETGDGTFDITYTRGKSEQVPGRGRAEDGPSPIKTSWITVEEDMAPTCYTNVRGGDLALCGAAVNTCPDGLIRFWVWHRTTRWTKAADGTVTSMVDPWQQEQGTFCLGADDPGVPTIARVLDRIRSDFTSLPLRVQAPRADPAPTTLVNLDTAFSAGTAEPQTFDPVLLGTTVHVTAKPVRWTWTWGDGTSQSFARPGIPKQPDVTHTYTRAGDRTVTVVVEWRGTFRVGSDPTEYSIQTPAYVRSAPMTVRVRTARSQLVR